MEATTTMNIHLTEQEQQEKDSTLRRRSGERFDHPPHEEDLLQGSAHDQHTTTINNTLSHGRIKMSRRRIEWEKDFRGIIRKEFLSS